MNDIVTDEALVDAKFLLMSNKPVDQLRCVRWILQLLDHASGDELHRFSKRIIDADIVIHICRQMCQHYGPLFTTSLKVVHRLILNDLFYKYKLANCAVESIVRVANFLMPCVDDHKETLALAVETIFKVLDRVSTTEFTVYDVCDPKQMILFVKNVYPLISNKNWYPIDRGLIGAARIVILLMKHIQPGHDDEIKSSLFTLFKYSLTAIYEMAYTYTGARQRFRCAMKLMISSCAIGTRFCGDTGDGARYTSKIAEMLIIFVIPNFYVRFSSAELEQNEKILIECLAKIHRFECCDKNLAFALANNGFIEGFIRTSSSSLRASTQSIVLYTIDTISEDGEDILDNMMNRRAADECLIGWYTMLHQVLAKTEVSGWSVIFRCLRTVLRSCWRNGFVETLGRLAAYSLTHEMVLRAIHHEYTDPTFFAFTEIWLFFCRSNIREMQSRLEFVEIVEMLIQHRNKLTNSGRST